MAYEEREKRKNSDIRRIPGWLLFIGGVIVGMVLLLLAQGSARPTETAIVIQEQSNEAFYLTATAIINEATAAAQGTLAPPAGDNAALLQTATAIISEATRQAGG